MTQQPERPEPIALYTTLDGDEDFLSTLDAEHYNWPAKRAGRDARALPDQRGD